MALSACLVALVVAGAASDPVARVVASTSNVTIGRARQSLPVAVDIPLERTDTLHVPRHGLLLVKVEKNGLVVRIDEDLDLAVSDIAALDAEQKTSAALSQQVDALLTQAEKKSVGTERLVGWFVSPTAANVVAGATVPAPVESPRPTGGGTPPGSRSGAAISKSDEPAPPPPGPAPKPTSSEVVVNSPRREPATPAASPPLQQPPATPKDDEPVVKKKPQKDLLTEKKRGSLQDEERSEPSAQKVAGPQLDTAARACFADWAAQQPPAVRKRLADSLTVRLRRDEAGVRLFLEGALPPTACMQQWADAQPLSDAWSTLEVPLK
jgi:hypothetical protein